MNDDGLPPLREVIARHGLRARKGLGQNFLLDLNLTAKIARAAAPLDAKTVLEIGPGPGGLTRALLAAGANVIAIERDERCLPALAEIAQAYPGRLTVIAGDALEADERALTQGRGPAEIVANLPYNVGTALLVKWLSAAPWPPWYSRLTLLFQREVADRFVASPGSKAYGRLSILAQWRTRPRVLFEIDPRAFTPPPKVTSALVQFEVLAAAAYPAELVALERVTGSAFGQRRKMLRQSLKTLGVPVEPLLAAACLAGTERAEDIPLAGFCALARALPSPSPSGRGPG
jgi:16S rRNA (adenine1518-N6/adenine1519-N6)-dimethyltransferase